MSNKTLMVLQPSYIPWLGFWEMLISSDIILIYDNVQFDKNGWRNRNKIKTPDGSSWITIPVLQSGRFGQKNYEVECATNKIWAKKHLKTFINFYKKSPYFDEIYELCEKILNKPSSKLLDIQLSFLQEIAMYLDIDTQFILSSEVIIDESENRELRLINYCKQLKCNIYINGSSGKELYSKDEFLKHNINLLFQKYEHPIYPQRYGDFIPYLSILDLLFNCGKNSKKIITKGKGYE